MNTACFLRRVRLLPFFLLFGVLAGCEAETEDPPIITPPVVTPPATFANYQEQMDDLHRAWDGVDISVPADLPYGGGATFNGVMGLTVETAAGALAINGALRVNADFTSNSLSGDVRDLVDQNENRLDGNLAITSGVLNRSANIGTDYTFGANIGGTLSGATETYTLLGDLSGDFHGPSYLATSGVVAGLVTSGFGTGYLFGSFIAGQ